MRILIMHSRYLSGDASGENRVVEDEVELLRDGGHEVLVWDPSPEHVSGVGLVATGVSAVWSRRATAHTYELIDRHDPDVVHCHNLFPMLSPGVIRAAAKRNTPLAMTLHNYRLMCLPAVFLRNGLTCEDCVGHVPWRGVVHRCYNSSLLGSGALAVSLSLHRGLRTFEQVSLFLAGSEFTRAKHIEGGLPGDQIHVKPNFARAHPRRQGAGDYFLFLGRLWPEKGADTLVKAWRSAPGRLVIVGDGPQRAQLEAAAPPQVEFMGQIPYEGVDEVLSGARALLVPSRTYETASRATLEAYAAGVPVLASDFGALAEMVENNNSGLLIAPNDADAWAEAARALLDDDLSTRLGDGAYRLWQQKYSPQRALRNLEEAYEIALERARSVKARRGR